MRLYKFFISLAAMSALPVMAVAQGLNVTETLEQVIVPEQQAAQRLNQMPALATYNGQSPRISFSEYGQTAPLTRSVAFNEPIPYRDSIEASPYRGYAALGYFPLYNLGLTAGYRLVNSPRTQVGAWLEFLGRSYKGDNYYDANADKYTLSQNAFTATIMARHRFGKANILTGNVDFRYFGASEPFMFADQTDKPSVNTKSVGLTADWRPDTDKKFFYYASLKYGLTAVGEKNIAEIQYPGFFLSAAGVNENRIRLMGGLGKRLGSASKIGLDIDIDNNIYSGDLLEKTYYVGYFSLNPYFAISGKNYNARIGLKAQMAVADTYVDWRLAPDVAVHYEPIPWLAIHAEATGGFRSNSILDLQQKMYGYYNPFQVYGCTVTNYNVGGGVTLGRMYGFSLDLNAHYAKAFELMPTVTVGPDFLVPLAAPANYGEFMGWKFDARVNLDVAHFAKVWVGGAISPNGNNHGWYQWMDRAHWTLDAGVKLKAFDRLDVDVDYTRRGGRKCQVYEFDPINQIYDYPLASIGYVSSLGLGASYVITDPQRNIATGTFTTPALSVFVRVDNLLNHRYQLMYGVPAQGIHGRIGVALKF